MNPPGNTTLASCECFIVDKFDLPDGAGLGNPDPGRFSIVTVVDGELRASDDRRFGVGCVLLLPRGGTQLEAVSGASVLQTSIPG